MASSIAKSLANNIGSNMKDSYWDAYTVIPEHSTSNLFAERFGIKENDDLEKFHQAFRVCTEGQGNELKSINNVVSSALLPLLTFFRLFGKNSGFSLKLKLVDSEPIEFDRCFFEVRNDVLRLPSCVDVALYSSKDNVLLFLESKLSEYLNISKELKIKKGYAELYSVENFKDILKSGKIEVDGSKLKLKNRERAYFEGIKQTISHLIGIVQGPSLKRSGIYYPEEYFRAYQECYDSAKTLYYSTIIFNPQKIGVSEEDAKKYDRYVELYSKIIGEHGREIIECIRDWKKLKKDQGKDIEVLSEPLDYHTMFANNRNLLLDEVRRFYRFEE